MISSETTSIIYIFFIFYTPRVCGVRYGTIPYLCIVNVVSPCDRVTVWRVGCGNKICAHGHGREGMIQNTKPKYNTPQNKN